MNDSDLQLLQSYTRNNSQDSFTTLVNRHLNLVFSAALRQVHSPQLAEEISQSVFADLARSANKLKPDTILTAWLYEVTRRTAIDVVRRESRRQLREKVAHELTAMNATADDWTDIEPFLDEAMHALDATDRAAVLLRYFENKTLREVGETLGTSDDAAQKRVSRAVERLREFFTKRGVTTGASGLVVVISANAVQAAPIGLAATISTAAILGGATLAATTTATLTKTLVMTTLQKTLITATLVAAVGTGIYEARQASQLREQNQTLQQQQLSLSEQIQRLQQERDDATNRLASLAEEIGKTKSNNSELLKLRGEIGALRRQTQMLAKTNVTQTNAEPIPSLSKGFGALGEYLHSENISDVGNSTAEALLQTFVWAIRESRVDRLEQIGGPFGGQSEPGDVVGEISKSQAGMFKMIQSAFTNAAGFRLSSKPGNDGQSYEVRLEAEPLDGNQSNDFVKNFHMSFVVEQKDNGWSFGDPNGFNSK